MGLSSPWYFGKNKHMWPFFWIKFSTFDTSFAKSSLVSRRVMHPSRLSFSVLLCHTLTQWVSAGPPCFTFIWTRFALPLFGPDLLYRYLGPICFTFIWARFEHQTLAFTIVHSFSHKGLVCHLDSYWVFLAFSASLSLVVWLLLWSNTHTTVFLSSGYFTFAILISQPGK